MPGPKFVIIGAAKAATTSLCLVLRRHPQVHIPARKELNFFSVDSIYARGVDWYHDQFHPDADRVQGEGSVSYSLCGLFPSTPERICRYRPDMKLVYLVRDPVERLLSYYLQLQAAGQIGPVSFTEALRESPELLDSARYWKQIRAYRQVFPTEQIQVLFFDDWVTDPQRVTSDCCRFVGVDPELALGTKQIGQTVGQWRDSRFSWALRRLPGFRTARDLLPPRARKRLRNIFKTPISSKPSVPADTYRFLEQELGEDMKQFLDFYGRPNLWSITAPR